jgi:hypothetical protein
MTHNLIPLKFLRHSVTGAVVCAMAWMAGGPLHTQAATPAASTPADIGSLSYTTKAGDTLNKIVLSQYKDSPLHTQILVKAVRQLNPQGLPSKADQRLKTGLTLQLPAHGPLVRDTLQAHLPEGSAVTNGQSLSREHWVRFP